MKEGKTVFDVVEVLTEGEDAPRTRKSGTVEKWLHKGLKTYNAVVVEDYDEIMKEDIWVLIHLGKFTRRTMR